MKYETRIKADEKETIKIELRELLELSRLDDITQARTTFGPHKDDFVCLLDGRDVRTFGSRGEFRSIVLSLKLAEIEFIKNETKKTPVLLLDDVFSELDSDRRKFLLQTVRNQQTILTTTDDEYLKDFGGVDFKVIEISEGKIK